jgi:hypothetical protein
MPTVPDGRWVSFSLMYPVEQEVLPRCSRYPQNSNLSLGVDLRATCYNAAHEGDSAFEGPVTAGFEADGCSQMHFLVLPQDIEDSLKSGYMQREIAWTNDDYVRNVVDLAIVFGDKVTWFPSVRTPEQPRESTKAAEVVYRVPGGWPEPTYEDRKFRDCKAAKRYVEHSKELGRVGWGSLEFDMNQKVRGTVLWDGRIKAEVVVNYELVPLVRYVRLTRLSWPNMTEAEGRALQAFVDALIAHEKSHIDLAAEFAMDRSNRLETAIGKNQQDARDKLWARVKSQKANDGQELKKLEKEYDDWVVYGARQSRGPQLLFPGGSDVKLTCPEE